MTDVELINNFLTELKRVEGRQFPSFEETIPTTFKYRVKDEDIKIWLAALKTHGYIRWHSANKSYPNGIWAIESKGHFALKNGGLTQETLDNIIESTFGDNLKPKEQTKPLQQFNIGQVGNLNTGNISGKLTQSSEIKSQTADNTGPQPTLIKKTIIKIIVGVVIIVTASLIVWWITGQV